MIKERKIIKLNRQATRGLSLAEKLAFYTRRSIDGCLLWVGANNGRYGQLNYQGQLQFAHRLVWELNYGPIPKGMKVLHDCDNTFCCDDTHLFLGTQKDNMDDMVSKGRRGVNPRKGLSDEAVIVAKKLRGLLSADKIGKRLGVSGGVIRTMYTGRTYKNIL